MQRRRPFCLLLDGGVRAEPPLEDGRQQDDAKHVPVALAKVVAEVAERDELKDEGGLAKCRVYRGAVRVAHRREYVEGGGAARQGKVSLLGAAGGLERVPVVAGDDALPARDPQGLRGLSLAIERHERKQ